jgi:hypothetical protein
MQAISSYEERQKVSPPILARLIAYAQAPTRAYLILELQICWQYVSH